MHTFYKAVNPKIIWRATRSERGESDRIMGKSRADREGEKVILAV